MTIWKLVWRFVAAAGRVGLVVLLAALPCFSFAADQDPVLSARVTDQAQVLGVSAANLESKLKAFETASGHQVFVLTVRTTGDRPIDQYAVEVFEKWKLGRAGVDNGVLFVVAVADRRMRFEVGYGLEGILTDAKCARIIREIVVPQLAQGRYEAGVEAGIDAVLLALSPPPVRASDSAAGAVSPDSVSPKPRDPIWTLLVFVGVLAVLAVLTIYVGLVGLLVFALFAAILSAIPLPGVNGKLMFGMAISAWLCGRWACIAKNVRERHLPGSKNHLLTWLWIFFFTRGSGNLSDTRQRSGLTVSFSFTASDTSNESTSDEPDCSGHGGRSGGGGASGQW
jgi:uncharacterized protein